MSSFKPSDIILFTSEIICFPPFLKGSDRLCKVVKLSMQCCGKLLSDSFETYKIF